jgi:hypothetical protein
VSNQTTRRTFIKLTAAAAASTNLPQALAVTPSIATLIDPALSNSEPIQWATTQLRQTLSAKSIPTTGTQNITIFVSLNNGSLAKSFNLPPFTQPETIALVPGANKILITGTDTRGLVYGLLELTDRIRYNEDPTLALHLTSPVIETTANKVRSIARAFVSEIEDKPWFYDRTFWTSYLDTLAFARFNRFNLAFGFGYDFPRGVTGDYLHFPYPYLVELRGYESVRVDPPLSPGERQRNLETLQYIAAEAARRGLQFQLGIWTHAYEWTDSPHADHRILGLTPETHAVYCRDALAALLKACPQISGLTLRIHGESGIPEGRYPFWQTLFEAVPAAGRPIELDLHAKGLDQTMIDIALKTGMPVKAGCKFWAEHQGLGYHQADIRETEYPRKGVTGTFAVSSGERNFTRYGYGDFYGQHKIEILYRVWPGTQRHLLWGDHVLAGGYGNAAHFCGAAGMELCEPLTFKGREGSGHPGGRNTYADSTLAAFHPDTNKFALTYLFWGRGLYASDGSLEFDFVNRVFSKICGASGPSLRMALAHSSRILPLITTAWLPSASNHSFWPEIYTPISILPPTGRPLYTDSPAPHNVSAISPLDPQLFTTIDQHATNLVTNKLDARYNPTEVANWLDVFVFESNKSLASARTKAGNRATSPEFRQIEEDILILNGLGLYFANLFRAALLYSIHEQTGDPNAATQSLAAYRNARDAWATMPKRASTIYAADISYGDIPIRRGGWADRLPAIDKDIADLEQHFANNSAQQSIATRAIELATRKPRAELPVSLRSNLPVMFTRPESFEPGKPLTVQIARARAQLDTTAILWYRHVNQAERWLSMPMQKTISASESATAGYTASVPADYTNSPYPLQYYFEFRTGDDAILYPLIRVDQTIQPYFAILPAK